MHRAPNKDLDGEKHIIKKTVRRVVLEELSLSFASTHSKESNRRLSHDECLADNF